MSASGSPRSVIEICGIHKAYGATVAVADVSFEVNEGEIFGLIGPNGAGKTTTMECVEGVRRPDRGTISILGLDPFRDQYALQNRIGVQLQQAQLQKRIKVREAVDLWASLYTKTVDGDRLLEQLGLASKRNAWFMTLSGGQKQRLFIALALINDPEVVFLDELTTGLDPQARRAIWELVRGIRERGKTVLMTTHLMEEAERLCDRVAIIERGKIIDIGTPRRAGAAALPGAHGGAGDGERAGRGAAARPAFGGDGDAAREALHHRGPGRGFCQRGDPVPLGKPDPGDGISHRAAKS